MAKKLKGFNPESKKNLKPFPPGKSGNPAGRPKGARAFKTVIKEILDMLASSNEYHEDDALLCDVLEDQLKRPVSRREAMVYKQVVKAMRGDTFAFNAIADREEGKPKQSVDVTTQTYEDFLDVLPEGKAE